MIGLLAWVIFGVVVGGLARWVYPVESEHGVLATLAIGVVGSFVGGFAAWVLGAAHGPYHPAGFAFSVLGAVACCAAWSWYSSQE